MELEIPVNFNKIKKIEVHKYLHYKPDDEVDFIQFINVGAKL